MDPGITLLEISGYAPATTTFEPIDQLLRMEPQSLRARAMGGGKMLLLAGIPYQPGLPLSSGSFLAYAPVMRASPDDSALMLRYKDGDTTAFEALYRRHNDALYRYLLRLCLHQHTAEDLYQETWSKIIRSRSRYRPTAKFTTFLYRVAHNCFIDHVRRNKRHNIDSTMDPDITADPGDGPALLVEKSNARDRLEEALLILPDEQRDVFLLHEEAGLNLDSIANVTGANRETVKSRLRYAVKKLKVAMADPDAGVDRQSREPIAGK